MNLKTKSLQKPLVFLFLLCLFPLGAMAQSIVKGTVNDETGEPVIGATVKVQGTNEGAITDFDGNFSVKAASNATLSVSYVGYITQQVAVGGRSTINIVLKEDTNTLNDVVVIGYGTMKKSDISGSVATINKEQMERKVPVNIAQALQGAAAGVMVTNQDGAPGTASAIRIRGIGTINGDAQPLYVVDGVQVGNNADFVNPSDIENIEILKDASASAIYGSAGANGVIMITTKHGQKGKMNINVTADFGIQTLPWKLDTLTGDDYARSIRESKANDGATLNNQIWSEVYDGKRNYIDWQDQMYQTGFKQQYGISASGGTDKTQYNFSVGYLNNKGIVVNTNYDRLTARASIKSKVNDYVEFGGDVNYMYSTVKGNNIGLGNNANLSSQRDIAQMAPSLDYIDDVTGEHILVNVVNPDGTYGASKAPTPDGWEGMTAGAQNPYASQMEIGRETRNSRISINPYIDITLLKLKEHTLNLHSIASWTQTNSDNDEFSGLYKRYNMVGGKMTQVTYQGRDQAYYSFGLGQSKGLSKGIETYLTYNWNTDFNNLTLMVGNSVSKYEGSWVSASAHSFPFATNRLISLTEDKESINGNGGFNAQVKTISYYGRLIYSLFDRYILTATVRRDGSSNFGSKNRWGTFPSAAFAWRITEEPFMKDVKWLNNAKLRIGWGQTGNAGNIAGRADYALATAETTYQFYKEGQGGGTSGDFTRYIGAYAPLVDNNLKWETNEQLNFGLDLGFLNNDLTVTIDYFTRKTKDLLLERQIRPSAGYSSIYTNFGQINNYGLEFSVNYNKRLNKDWSINVAFNGSTLKNEIKKMGVDYTSTASGGNSTYSADDIDGSNIGAISGTGFVWNDHSICREGEAVGSYYGYRVAGIIKTEEDLAKAKAQGQNAAMGDYLFVDTDGNGTLNDADRVILGNGLPSFNFGLNLSATYKNWDFSVYTYGVLGMDILSYSKMRMSIMNPSDDSWTPALGVDSYAAMWSESNPNGSLPRLTRLDNNKNSRISDAWIENGNFLKISNIQVGYTLPRDIVKKLLIQNARVYFAIQNLATISPYTKYGDPEVGQGSVIYTGLDTGRYATPRTFQFGLNITF
ncbi:MAG: TonB-dependent receptor [Prevotella sp.]|nr:TonB-dependent receptor [Prevotella sp.]